MECSGDSEIEMLPTLKKEKVLILIQGIVEQSKTANTKLYGKSLGDLVKYFSTQLNPGQFSTYVPVLRKWYKVHSDTMSNTIAPAVTVTVSFEQRALVAAYQKIIRKTFFAERDQVGSFAVLADDMVGTIPLDVYFTCMLLFASCVKRKSGDSLLMPVFSGVSSIGKSRISESAMEKSKSVNFSGSQCGRYKSDEKNCFYLNDVTFRQIYSDAKIFKNICRAELTEGKTFASTETISPHFMFLTSNETFLKNHTFRGKQILPTTLPVPSNQDICTHEKHVTAIRKRLIEFSQQERAEGLENIIDLPFRQEHATLGLCGAIITRLQEIKHPLKTKSKFFFEYLFETLFSHAELFALHQRPSEMPYEKFHSRLLELIHSVKANIISKHESKNLERELESIAEENAQETLKMIPVETSRHSPSPIKIRKFSLGRWGILKRKSTETDNTTSTRNSKVMNQCTDFSTETIQVPPPRKPPSLEQTARASDGAMGGALSKVADRQNSSGEALREGSNREATECSAPSPPSEEEEEDLSAVLDSVDLVWLDAALVASNNMQQEELLEICGDVCF